MTRHLHIHPCTGLSEAALLAALVDAGAPAAALEEELSALGWGQVSFECAAPRGRGGGLSCGLSAPGPDRALQTPEAARSRLAQLALSSPSKNRLLQAWDLFLAAAAGRTEPARPVSVEEVGGRATPLLLAALGFALDHLRVTSISCTALPLPCRCHAAGGGQAADPVTLELLQGLPTAGTATDPGTVTPLAVAFVKAAAGSYGPAPAMVLDAAGTAIEPPATAEGQTVLQAFLGTAAAAGTAREPLVLLEANLDDLSGEILGTLISTCLAAGALDAWLVPVLMKKGRPGHLLTALCEEPAAGAVESAIFRETSTLGVRRLPVQRDRLERATEEVTTPWGPVRVKIATWQGAVMNRAPEFEDCLRIADEHGVPLKEVYAAALASLANR